MHLGSLHHFALAASCALALACGSGETPPDRVALAFWEALRDGDTEAALRHADTDDPAELENAFGGRAITSVSVGETLLGEERARVATELSDGQQELAFDTRLTRGPDGWRVALGETGEESRRSALGAAFSEVDEALEEGRRLIGEALERGAREASRALRRAQEELDEAFPPPPEPEPAP